MLKYCLSFLIILLSLQVSFAQNHEVALEYVKKHQSELKLNDESIRNCVVRDYYTSKHNGVQHIYLQQTISGISVENTTTNINVSKTGKVLNINNRFTSVKNLEFPATPAISSSQALDLVLQHINIPLSEKPELRSKLNDVEQTTTYAPMKNALDEVSAKLHYFQTGKKEIKLTWKVVIEVHNPDFHIWVMYVDSATGEIIEIQDRVIKCTFDHQHDNSCTSTPFFLHDECEEETETVAENALFAPDSYLAFPLRVESPNHGERELLVDPADPVASPFGWHDTDGVAGPEFTYTRGNNVIAQDDINGNNGSGYSPDGGNSLDFVFTQDLTQNPATNGTADNLNSSITNLFVWNNLMHDIWYNYGFDEVSGNFQDNNYGNGGQDGDYVLADGQDGSGTSNANFASGTDGNNGRMQMFMWTAPATTPSFSVNTPSTLAGNYNAVAGSFGQQTYNVTGELILMDDGSAQPTLGCEQTSGLLDGKIAVIDRGDCQFGTKALLAENGGAIAVIVCNNEAGGAAPMGPGNDGGDVTIPAIMISQEDCATIRIEIPNGVEVNMVGGGSFQRDGSLDNGIISHEYGHGISTRMTGGPSNSGCLSNAEQAGEGWSDYFALVMTQELDHDRNTVRGIGTYATSTPIDGNGIRTYPYTTDMSINPHTYADIVDESVPHGVGSVFCVMLWDLYWNLVDEYGFDEDIYNGTGGNNIAMQLVIDGIKLQPCSPGFIDSRDAILLADQVNNDGANQCLIWETFARRGLGYSASQGNSGSSTDGSEAFDLPPSILDIEKSSDVANAEAGETVVYTINIGNKCEEFTNVEIKDFLPSNMTYVEGSASDGGMMDNGILVWPTIATLPQGSNRSYSYQATVNADVEYSIAETFNDDMESGDANWTVSNSAGLSNWTLIESSGNTTWFAEELEADPAASENQYLTMSASLNGITELSFSHKYDTEQNWDGGTVEISVDNGSSWTDLGDNFVENGYNDYIQNSQSVQAFSGNSGGYITSKVDLTEFCGEDVLIRFNFYYDQLEDGRGWNIDDVSLVSSNALINIAEANSNGNISTAANCIRVNGGVVISNEDLSVNTEVEVYPNPSNGNDIYLTIQSEKAIGDLGIKVFNAAGQFIYSDNKQISNDFVSFKLMEQKLAPGIYTVQLLGDEFSTVKKFIVL